AEVGQGNRYTQPTPAATGYLNVEEVEAALQAAAAGPFSRIMQLVALPEPTWELRQCHAVRIGSGVRGQRPGVYFLGGVHAREWGSCDILINFIERLGQAYIDHAPLQIGAKTFSAAEIASIVDSLDVVVFPQA